MTQFFANNQYEWGLRHQETHRTPQPRGYKLTYTNYPKYYRWDKATKTWVRRKRYNKHGTSGYIGRMRYVPPAAEARQTFYLRLLLHVTEGPRSFEDVKKVDGVMYDTYKEACFARGTQPLNPSTHVNSDQSSNTSIYSLPPSPPCTHHHHPCLPTTTTTTPIYSSPPPSTHHHPYLLTTSTQGLIEDDAEWDAALSEASLSAMPAQIRQLFVIILSCCDPLDPARLWKDHRDAMSQDFSWSRQRQQNNNRTTDIRDCDYDSALRDIEDRLQEYVVSDLHSYGLPTPAPPEEDSNDTDVVGTLPREVRTPP